MHLMRDLLFLSDRWLAEQRRTDSKISLKTLATRCVGDSKLYDRIHRGGTIAVATYEKIVDGFFANPDNWPAGMIPADVVGALVRLGSEVQVQRPLPLG